MRDFLFGGSCILCRGRARSVLCADCDAELPRLRLPLCPRCALASPGGALCGRCLAEPPHYDATVAALAYAFPADVLIQALKFRGELALAPFLGGLFLEKDLKIDLVLPVPLSNERLKERGFNQAVELARVLANATRAPLDAFSLKKKINTAGQADLPLAERRRNVAGAFECARRLDGARVAVVDDVMTSGATLDEVAKVLKSAGAAHVTNCVVARTLPP